MGPTMTRPWSWVGALLTAALIVACSANPAGAPNDASPTLDSTRADGPEGPDAAPATASQDVGPDGGTVTLGGLTFTVPPRALTREETITITRTADLVPSGYHGDSPVYRFEPAGLKFEVPASVQFPFTGEPWTWNGTVWTQQMVSGPPARHGAMMAALNGGLVLFGGEGGTILSDTWVWNGTTWTQQNVVGPPGRDYAGLAIVT